MKEKSKVQIYKKLLNESIARKLNLNKIKAYQFIANEEGYDKQFYSAYIYNNSKIKEDVLNSLLKYAEEDMKFIENKDFIAKNKHEVFKPINELEIKSEHILVNSLKIITHGNFRVALVNYKIKPITTKSTYFIDIQEDGNIKFMEDGIKLNEWNSLEIPLTTEILFKKESKIGDILTSLRKEFNTQLKHLLSIITMEVIEEVNFENGDYVLNHLQESELFNLFDNKEYSIFFSREDFIKELLEQLESTCYTLEREFELFNDDEIEFDDVTLNNLVEEGAVCLIDGDIIDKDSIPIEYFNLKEAIKEIKTRN